MTSEQTRLLHRNDLFVWIALLTGLLLCVPAVGMLVTPSVSWSVGDFIVMGILLYGSMSLFVMLARRLSGISIGVAALFCTLGFLAVWAELAVGIFN